MTENKRFDDAKGYVYDGKNCIGIITDDYTCENIINLLNALNDENEQLKQELFESQVDYYAETYHDNPIRADDKINSLKREFKARFGKEFKYG